MLFGKKGRCTEEKESGGQERKRAAVQERESEQLCKREREGSDIKRWRWTVGCS